MATPTRITRRVSGAPGAPATLRSGQVAYNMVDGILYVGFGDDGSGNATSVKAFAKDDFSITFRVPTGGTTGQVLTKTTNSDYAMAWQSVAQGAAYTEGAGIDITGTVISVDVATFPAFDAAKVTSGTFDATRIPSLDASKITTGTFDIARLPVLPSSIQIVSSGDIAALTVPQQDQIGSGTVVTTTDGRRWVYSGSGTKTLEASYIELADISPEWTAIANKPAFATVATSGLYNDLTGKPTLGTMSAQNANAVAITGGTIDGIELDGGTF